jgi:hypothetical protein
MALEPSLALRDSLNDKGAQMPKRIAAATPSTLMVQSSATIARLCVVLGSAEDEAVREDFFSLGALGAMGKLGLVENEKGTKSAGDQYFEGLLLVASDLAFLILEMGRFVVPIERS